MNCKKINPSKRITGVQILSQKILVLIFLISFVPLLVVAQAQKISFTEGFKNPEAKYRPHMRMWIPQAAIDENTLRSQINDLADAGVGDIELVAFDIERRRFGASEEPAEPAISTEVYGWGTPNWTNTMQILLDQAGKRGIKATFTVGPAWPVASPLLKKSSPGVEVQLSCTKHDVTESSYNGEVIGNINRDGVPSQLMAVVAGKRTSNDIESEVDINSLIDLTKNVVNHGQSNTINWEAPDESGQWSLYFYWSEPVGEIKSDCFVVDHFSMEGTQAVLAYYKSVFEIFEKMNLLQYLSGLFGDSLEYRAQVDWTPELLAIFKKLKGYDLTPYLPAINNGIKTEGGAYGGIFGGGFGKESFGGLGEKILNDYYDVLTYLFNENHLKPIQAFLENYGQNLRYQTAYGKHMEQASTSMNVGIPEGEMMMIRNTFDNIRAQSGAVHMTNKIEYNAELQAEGNKNHAQSWENLLFFVQRTYSAGVNNTTLHGYNYNGVFNGQGNENGHLPNLAWPGWEGFGRDGYSNSWGAEPLWRHARIYLDFMARNSFILKQGKAKIDLAVFRESFWDNASFTVKDGDAWYKDGGLLQDMGYSYDFIGLPNLKLPNASVVNGRLDNDGPAYKALILDQSLNTSNDPVLAEDKSIGIEAAQKILELAKAGWPVVYIGETPQNATFLNPVNEAESTQKLQALVNELKSLKNVKNAKTFNDVPVALASLGINPDAQYSLKSNQSKLINIHRAAEGVDYYYVYNRGFNSNSGPAYDWNYDGVQEQIIPDVSTEITFNSTGTPYLLNTWTGEITPIACYEQTQNSTLIPIRLKGNESTIIAFDKTNVLGTPVLTQKHIIFSGDTQSCFDKSGKLAIKASSNGQHFIKLSDGLLKSITVEELPAPINLTSWNLSVEDWGPGTNPTSTAKTTINVQLDYLKHWGAIEELKNSSGIGTYSTTFEMGKAWDEGIGAYLDLGIVNYAYKLKINGSAIKVSQINTKVDIGSFLKSGKNTIEVEVSTTLNNRLKKLYDVTRRTDDFYGLIGSGSNSAIDGSGGSVKVIPYSIMVID
nr:glycosyl hydrolase [uncultured Draconibacterium sp.]